MKDRQSTWVRILGLAVFLASTSLQAQQTYPSKPIRFISIATPGTVADLVIRVLAENLNERLGWTTVVENRVSADWIVPAVHVAQSAPDGYTILEGLSGMTLLPSTHKKLPYDLVKDFAPITRIATADTVLVAHPSIPARNLKELIAYSKANPGKLTYGSTGISNPLAIIMEQFKLEGGLDVSMIGYKTSSAFMADVLTGRISMALTSVGNVADLVKEGKLRALLMTQPRRNQTLPDVESTVDAGFPNADAGFWFSLMVPARTPGAVINTLHREVVASLQTGKMQAGYTKIGVAATWDGPEELKRRIDGEIANWARVIRDAKLKFD